MDQDAASPEAPVSAASSEGLVTASPAPVDLSALERIERELHAVEAALQQIDAGVYDGFEGLDLAGGPAPEPPA